MKRGLERVRDVSGIFDAHPLALDVTLIVIVTAVAAALRLTLLGDIPYGVHPDEAQIGTDAFRIDDDGWIGVYTHAALGQPTGNAYITWPGIWALGNSAFALRLPLALVALATVPLLYLVVRVGYGRRPEAFFGAALLAGSYWHLFYSRVAHFSISYGTFLLAGLLGVMLGVRMRHPAWLLAGGAMLGLGIYTYNVAAIAVAGVAVFLLAMTLLTYLRSDDRRDADWWWRSATLCLSVAFLVALPFLIYLSDPDAYFWTHIDDYRDTGITRSEEFQEAGQLERAKILATQVRDFVATYTWDGKPDLVDANGLRPVFDPLTLALIAVGAVLAWRERRQPMVVAAIVLAIVIPLPAVLQRGSMMRQPIAAAPFLMFLAALPLAMLWRAAPSSSRAVAFGFRATAILAVAAVAALTVRDYFWTWREDPLTRFVYHQEITAASEYMRELPPGTYVYFYSERHPLRLETREFLAPDVVGEDRSREFGTTTAFPEVDGSRRVSFVLLGDYLPLIEALERRYPGGIERVRMRGGEVDFIAYELPPRTATQEDRVD